eukprot:TRINITY_DN6933_c0_g1_i3.p1 TRINITY_DN6933_c0_g1~~TRINITY_DN6933_c0_g1_i3.p1  ORF type:complete len:118 (-),score=0.92 TRINITY_DN6933_c0_g1_i3:7-360(-)
MTTLMERQPPRRWQREHSTPRSKPPEGFQKKGVLRDRAYICLVGVCLNGAVRSMLCERCSLFCCASRSLPVGSGSPARAHAVPHLAFGTWGTQPRCITINEQANRLGDEQINVKLEK